MANNDLSAILLDWSSIFMRLSLHDFNQYARTTGLSLVQMSVLMYLHYHGPAEVSRFNTMLQISPAGASQMIARMVQLGMVQRTETPDDRRVRLVNLSAKGRRFVAESIAARQGWIDELALSFTEVERERIKAALLVLNKHALKLDVQA